MDIVYSQYIAVAYNDCYFWRRGLVVMNRESLARTFHVRKHQNPLNLMDLIYETWHRETQLYNK